ncbi:GIY-YIG nuclease family protein [Nonomuraea sp. NPDC049152]|uniref:GIY-YIG nuclease family protein n=1 Tax=Nonomuraea sp. NPDC049152 TaxID=3154350 RepID=UPI0033D24F14
MCRKASDLRPGKREDTHGLDGRQRPGLLQAHPEPSTAESELIAQLDLPLNLDQNRNHAFHQHLSALRAFARARARELPSAC